MTTTEVSETLERVDHWRKIKKAQQRMVLCRLMIDMMRTVHGAYAPVSEPFGTLLSSSAYASRLVTSMTSRFLSLRLLPICAYPAPPSYAGSISCNVGV